MDEIWVAIIGLIIAVGIVGIIHWLLVGHVNIGSDTKQSDPFIGSCSVRLFDGNICFGGTIRNSRKGLARP